MKTLKLNKDCKGYYSNQAGAIRISVSEFNGEWTGVIENQDATEDKDFTLYKIHTNTKKEAVQALTNYLINQ